jgi:hypothetical protein
MSIMKKNTTIIKKILSIKASACCQISMHLWVFLSLTLLGQEQEEQRGYYAREHGATSTIQSDALG